MGAGVAVHLPVNLHGFSVREEEDRENISTQRTKPMRSTGRTRVHAVVSAGKETLGGLGEKKACRKKRKK